MTTFPVYLISHEEFIDQMQKVIERDPNLQNDPEILETMYELHYLDKDYKTAFSILVKLKSNRIFDFLKRTQLDFDFPKYLGKLLQIDPEQTVEYILQRFGRIQQLKIVDRCV